MDGSEHSVAAQDAHPTDVSMGLTNVEYEKSLAEHGKNEVLLEPVSMLKLFVQQFIGVMQLILLICAVLSAVWGDFTDFGIIIGERKLESREGDDIDIAKQHV